MRSRLFLSLVAIVAVALIAPAAGAADGANANDLLAAGKAGAEAAAPAALSGNWLGAIFGFFAAAIPGALMVLQRQAQDKWHLFHAQNAIDTARAQVPPGFAPPAAPAPSSAPSSPAKPS